MTETVKTVVAILLGWSMVAVITVALLGAWITGCKQSSRDRY